MKGHVGNILKIDLTTKSIITIPTQKYEQWVGGIGIGTALFWDEIDKDYLANSANTTGFEPENVLCVIPGVLTGTLAPSGGRTEVCGIGPESYPRPQFTRGNFGGRFGPMLKFAGYDGIVVTGKSNKPVWIDIRDKEVIIKDATNLWGLGAYETQEEIWREVNSEGYEDWFRVGSGRKAGRSTQRPAVLTTGQSGERLARISCLIHDAGNSVGQGGFGAVFGSKNLKAISVIGTGAVEVADPKGLILARKWLEKYNFDVDNGIRKSMCYSTGRELGNPPSDFYFGDKYGEEMIGRPLGCFACLSCSRSGFRNNPSGLPGGESQCVEALFYKSEDVKRNGKDTVAGHLGSQLLQDYALNAYELFTGLPWLESLYERGLLGEGKKIHTDLDFSQLGTTEFVEEFLRRIAYREEIGDVLADGLVRAAEKWGVLEEDLKNGLLPMIYWIGEVHWGDDLNWAYQSLFSSRDLNQHDVSKVIDWAAPPDYSAKQAAEAIARLGAPWHDPMMADRSEEGIYSQGMARCVAWNRRHIKFWKNSAMFCDQCFPSWMNTAGDNLQGASPEVEVRFFNAVTGAGFSYEDGLELGRKIWNFERAILVLQGRHRDEEYFPPFKPYTSYVHTEEPPFIQKGRYFTVYEDGEWRWKKLNFPIRKDKMDEFKTRYYQLEGWSANSGSPTKETLGKCGLEHVADELAKRGLLG